MVDDPPIRKPLHTHRLWPPLPSKCYIIGRAATLGDIDSGDAIFCQQADDEISPVPLSIAIPQYGMLLTGDGEKIPGVIVQAEHHVSNPYAEAILGMRTLDGEEVVAMTSEIELLGVTLPKG